LSLLILNSKAARIAAITTNDGDRHDELSGGHALLPLTAGKYPEEFRLSEGMNEPSNVSLAGLVAWIVFIMYASDFQVERLKHV
jgi:hypothetical protein